MSEATPQAAQATTEAAQSGQPASTPSQAEAQKAPEAKAQVAEAPKAEAAKAPTAEAPKAEGDKKAAEATVTKETKPTEGEKPAVPEKYELTLPKDSALSPDHVEKLSAYAKEQGLSNEQAQGLLERESKAVSEYAESQAAKLKETADSWFEKSKGDKEIGGEAFKQNAELAKRVVSRFGTEDFKKELSKTGLGNHPELIRVFTRIGKAMSDDQLVVPGAQSAGKKSIESLLYGDGDNKES